MAPPNDAVFRQLWPRCFLGFTAIIELIAVIVLFLTELGNVAANFWTTNVFAGGWCGLVMLIFFLSLAVTAWCSPGYKSASRAVVIACIGLVATAALISFDAVFVAQPTTCILTSSCAANSVSNTTFSYSFQQSFFTAFNGLSAFRTYTQTEAKFLFQTVQLGVGSLCFVICIIYLIVYYICESKSKQQVGPSPRGQQQDYYGSQSQSYYGPPPVQQESYAPPSQQAYYQPPAPAWRPPPQVPQPPPGAIPWNSNRRY